MQAPLLGVLMAIALAFTASAAPKRVSTSDLFPFRGNYAGVFTYGLQSPAEGSLYFLKKRHAAVLTLLTTLDQGASSAVQTERIQLQGRTFTYTISVISTDGSTSFGRGSGTAVITRKSISFSTSFKFVTGDNPWTFMMVVRFGKKGMSVHRTMMSGSDVILFSYELQRTGSRK